MTVHFQIIAECSEVVPSMFRAEHCLFTIPVSFLIVQVLELHLLHKINATIFAKNTTFRNNYGFIGSQINAENSVYVYLENILFDYNDTGKVTGVGFRIISHSSIRIFWLKIHH